MAARTCAATTWVVVTRLITRCSIAPRPIERSPTRAARRSSPLRATSPDLHRGLRGPPARLSMQEARCRSRSPSQRPSPMPREQAADRRLDRGWCSVWVRCCGVRLDGERPGRRDGPELPPCHRPSAEAQRLPGLAPDEQGAPSAAASARLRAEALAREARGDHVHGAPGLARHQDPTAHSADRRMNGSGSNARQRGPAGRRRRPRSPAAQSPFASRSLSIHRSRSPTSARPAIGPTQVIARDPRAFERLGERLVGVHSRAASAESPATRPAWSHRLRRGIHEEGSSAPSSSNVKQRSGPPPRCRSRPRRARACRAGGGGGYGTRGHRLALEAPALERLEQRCPCLRADRHQCVDARAHQRAIARGQSAHERGHSLRAALAETLDLLGGRQPLCGVVPLELGNQFGDVLGHQEGGWPGVDRQACPRKSSGDQEQDRFIGVGGARLDRRKTPRPDRQPQRSGSLPCQVQALQRINLGLMRGGPTHRMTAEAASSAHAASILTAYSLPASLRR